MKITKKPGINNAFWLTGQRLEIDVVEARLPNIINGKAVCTIETKYPGVPADIRFSTAIDGWDGVSYQGPNDDPTSTEMDVAWVRVSSGTSGAAGK